MAKWLGSGGSAFYGERVSPWSSLLLVASWGQQAMAPGIPPLEPIEKELSQKNHVVCLLVFNSICVLIFGVFTVHHFIPKFNRRGILTEAFHFYTSDKTSIFIWLALSIFLCFFFISKILFMLSSWSFVQYGFVLLLMMIWWEKIHFYKLLRIGNFLPAPYTCCALHTDWRNDP